MKQQLITDLKNDGCELSTHKLNDLPIESLEFIVTLRNWTKERQGGM